MHQDKTAITQPLIFYTLWFGCFTGGSLKHKNMYQTVRDFTEVLIKFMQSHMPRAQGSPSTKGVLVCCFKEQTNSFMNKTKHLESGFTVHKQDFTN